MTIIEEHASNDGLLKFIVCRADDGDVAINFEGFAWHTHTHADVLASSSGLSKPDAMRRFIDDMLEDRAISAVSRVDGVAGDVCITEDPAFERLYPSRDETIEFRSWSSKFRPETARN